MSEDFPALQLPPQFGQVSPFKMERISHYDEAGPGWYWNNFSCGEHTGTHFDAPAHWVTGKDHPRNTVDTIAPDNFIAPAVVVDASAEVADDPDWLLTVEFLEAWESTHGRIPEGAWVLFRTDGPSGSPTRPPSSTCAKTARTRRARRKRLSNG